MATEYLHYTPHAGVSNHVAVIQRGLFSNYTHGALRPDGADFPPDYYTFGVLILSTLEPLALLQAYKAHQDYSNPDMSKLLSKNPADRYLTQVQSYYASLSPLLVAGFFTTDSGTPVPACFKDTFVTHLALAPGHWFYASVVIPSAKRMGATTNEPTIVPGGLAYDLHCPSLCATLDAKCHASGTAKSFLITGHAIAQDGSKLLDAECDAAYASAFAVDLTGSVSDNAGTGDLKMENPAMTAGKVYSFQDLAIAPNFSLTFKAA